MNYQQNPQSPENFQHLHQTSDSTAPKRISRVRILAVTLLIIALVVTGGLTAFYFLQPQNQQNQQNPNNTANNSQNNQNNQNTGQETTTIPTLDTSCPAEGTVRPAVTGTFQSTNTTAVVFAHNTATDGTIRIYESETGQQREVLFLANEQISHVTLSADGQWIAFTSAAIGEIKNFKIQLVRLDGQGHQTLHCTGQAFIAQQISWSPNQSYIAYGGTFQDAAKIFILDIDNGELLTPVSTPHNTYSYSPLNWSNNSLYVSLNYIGVGGLSRNQRGLFLIEDVTQNATAQTQNFTEIALPIFDNDINKESSYDIHPETGEILYNTSQIANDPGGSLRRFFSGPSTIGIHAPATPQPTIIHEDAGEGINFVRYASPTSILFTIQTGDPLDNSANNGLWKINTDGTGLTKLTSSITTLPLFSQESWSPVSPDSKMYIVEENTKVMIGFLDGGEPEVIASSGANRNHTAILIAGWTII